jgi:hypothetical protein
MYRFGLADMSVLIAATSVVVISTGVMPGWLALAGFVAALFALLRFLIPLGAFSGCAILLVVIIEEVGIHHRCVRSDLRLGRFREA